MYDLYDILIVHVGGRKTAYAQSALSTLLIARVSCVVYVIHAIVGRYLSARSVNLCVETCLKPTVTLVGVTAVVDMDQGYLQVGSTLAGQAGRAGSRKGGPTQSVRA